MFEVSMNDMQLFVEIIEALCNLVEDPPARLLELRVTRFHRPIDRRLCFSHIEDFLVSLHQCVSTLLKILDLSGLSVFHKQVHLWHRGVIVKLEDLYDVDMR